ncbi:MAG TPA: exodeoxyribonuclease VII small subunit [Chloroflexota bacterium]|nr:exodeoxyribonuclease VII small subunit [Chloroflexota bacterium]
MPDGSSNGQAPKPVEELTFEQAYAELEQTAQALQQGQLSLDDTLRLYERGSLLARYCLQKLEGVELKVAQLLSRPDGTYTTKPVTSEKDVTPPEPQPAEPAASPPAASADPDEAALREQKELFD